MEFFADSPLRDQNSDYQLKGNPLADSLRSMVNWSNFGNPFLHLHPIRPFAIKYYNEIMDMYVRRAVNLRFEEVRREAIEAKRHQSKSILALALRDYMKERETTDLSDITLDTAYAKAVASQLRLFLFAGHDTTTSILVYTYHALHKNPDALQRLQDEHTAVFGSDTESCDKLLAAEPHLINQLHYTTAVIKETMRMHPPAGAERAGVPGVALYDRYNAAYPTKGVTLSIQHSGLHHHPRLWPRVNEFLPERWLVEEGHELYPRHGAFRVFEHGARNCIGQNLSMIELKVVLVMTVRKFKIQPAYEEWDELRPIGWKERLFGRRKVASLNGERAYQVEKGAAHPKDGYPCRVSRVNA